MKYAKFAAAVVTAALLAAQTAVPMSAAAHGWITVALSALGAIAVYAIPNTTPPVPAPAKGAGTALAILVALVLTAGLLGATATPAHAAIATRPVTLTGASACVQGHWTVTVTVMSTRDRLVDVGDTSDYGTRELAAAVPLRAGVAWRLTYRPGASAQYAEIGVFPAGSGGWDGWADPLVWKLVVDPIQYDPHALC